MSDRSFRFTYLRLLLAGIAAYWVCAGSYAAHADDWPQWRGARRDGVWRENGIVEKFDSPQLAIKWRAPIGSGYSGPTVAAGRVYVADRITEPEQVERVLCFNESTGERIWMHQGTPLLARKSTLRSTSPILPGVTDMLRPAR